MKPYFEDGLVTIYHGDCLDIMPSLGGFDLVFADPPYGIDKAAWDGEWDLSWAEVASERAPVLAVTPGVWNLTAMPQQIGRLKYRWTLAAHLANGMTRGRLGFGNWIPCVIYSRPEDVAWTSRFADWCASNGVSKDDLGRVTSTSDMAGWWMSRLEHRAQVPTPELWALLRAAFNPPASFDDYVMAADQMQPGPDSASLVVGADAKADHPSPKPIAAMRWFLDRIPGYRLSERGVLDPFMGSGTTLVAAREVGRRAVGIEREERYCEVAVRRLSQQTLGLSA